MLSYVDLGLSDWESAQGVLGKTGLGVSTGPGWAGRRAAPPRFSLQQGHATTTHHNRQHQFPKKILLFQVAKRSSVSVGALAGRRGRCGVGLGLCLSLQKSNTFYKKAINWYQKEKTQGGCRMKQRGTRETARTNTVEDRRGGAVQELGRIQSACQGSPQRPPEADGQGLWPGEAQLSPHWGPTGTALPETARWEGPATEGREAVSDGTGRQKGHFDSPCPGASARPSVEEIVLLGTSSLVSAPQGCCDQRGRRTTLRPPSLSLRRKAGWTPCVERPRTLELGLSHLLPALEC